MSQLAVFANGVAVMLQPVSISQLNHILGFEDIFQRSVLIVEPFFIVAMMFLSLTIATILIYYRRIRRASKAYEEAKNAVGDIVISFDRQLNRHEEQIGIAVQRLEAQQGRDERLARQLNAQESRISSVMADLAAKAAKSPDIESVKATLANLEERVEGLSKAQ